MKDSRDIRLHGCKGPHSFYFFNLKILLNLKKNTEEFFIYKNESCGLSGIGVGNLNAQGSKVESLGAKCGEKHVGVIKECFD